MVSFSPFALIIRIIFINYVIPITTEIGINPSESTLINQSNTKIQQEDKIEEKLDDENTSNFTDTENEVFETEASSTDDELISDTKIRSTDDNLLDSTSKYTGSVEVEKLGDKKSPGLISNLLFKLDEEKASARKQVKRDIRNVKKMKEKQQRLEFISKGLPEVRSEDIMSEDKFALCSELDENKKDIMKEGEAPTCKFYCLYRKMQKGIFVQNENGVCRRELIQTNISNKVGIFIKTDRVCFCEMSIKAMARFIQFKDAIYFVMDELQSTKLVTVHNFLLTLKMDLNDYKRKYIEARQKKWNKKHRLRNIFHKDSNENWFNLATNYVSKKLDDTGKTIFI